MEEPIYRLTYNEHDFEEVMVQYPNGTIKFIGLWATIKLTWTLLRSKKIVYINGEKI